MTPKDFNLLMSETFLAIGERLKIKEKEYSEGLDRLDQFKKGLVLTGQPPHQVLRGMMLKHTTSVYDMLQTTDTNLYTLERWEEKLFDHINYLLLLYAIVVENSKVPLNKEFSKKDNYENLP